MYVYIVELATKMCVPPSLPQLKQVKKSNQELLTSNRELQLALTKALKSIDRLVAERTVQLEQQALWVPSLHAPCAGGQATVSIRANDC